MTFNDKENDAIRCGVATGEDVRVTARRLGRRAQEVAQQRIDLGLSEHEEFAGSAALWPALPRDVAAI